MSAPKLTPAQKRALVAESRGIAMEEYQHTVWGFTTHWEETRWRIKGTDNKPAPDYLGSRDAMAEALESLTEEQKNKYAETLAFNHQDNYEKGYIYCAVFSSLEQCVNAYLLTLGLATEDQL